MRKILVLLIALALWTAPVQAQETTPEPTPVPPTVVVPPASDTVQLTWTALVGLITIVLTTGLAGGVGGAMAIVRSVRNNEVVITAMERLFESTPPSTQEQIRKLVELVVEGGVVLDDITDRDVPKP